MGNGKRSLKGQLGLLFGGSVVEKAIGFLALIVFARLFSPSELALVAMYFIAASAAVMTASLGAMPVLTVELPRVGHVNQQSASAMIRTVFDGYLLGSLICIAILAAFPGASGLSAKIGLPTAGVWLFIAGAFAHGMFTLLTSTLSGLSRFDAVVRANIYVNVVRLALVTTCHYFLGTLGVVVGLLASSLVGVAYAGWCARDHLSPTGERWGLRSFLTLSWPLYIEGFLMFMRRQGDQVIVGSMLGPEALAGYYLARRFSALLKTFADAVNVALAPALSRLSLKSDAEFAVRWRRLLSQAMTFSVPMALLSAIVAPAHIAVVGGAEYAPYALPAAILCLGSIVDIVKGPIVTRAVFVLYSPRARVYLTTAEALLLLPLLALGTWQLGPTGTAIGVVLGGLLAGWLGLYVLRRRLDTWSLRHESVQWIVPPCIAGAAGLAASVGLRHLPVHVFEIRELVAAAGGASVFMVAYVNLLPINTLALVESTLADTRLRRAIPILHTLRLRR